MTSRSHGSADIPGGSGSGSGSTRAITIGMVALVTLAAFEELAVSTAMPVAAADLGGVREYGLAFSLYITTSLLGTVWAGGWADLRGPSPPLVAGLLAFAAGLFVCGFATNFPVMLAGRALSGLGGGMQIVALYVLVGQCYPEWRHPQIFAWLSAAWVLPSIVGPALAGWVAVTFTWRAVFLSVPPLALLAWLVMLRGLAGARAAREPAADHAGLEPEVRSEAGAGSRSLGVRGRAAYGLGVAAGALLMQWGSQQVRHGYGVPVALAGLVVMGVTAVPLLPPGALRLARGLASVVVTRGLLTACFYAAETFVPLLLVADRGISPARAGLVLTGGALGWAAGAWFQGQPWLHWPRRRLLTTGAAILAIGVALLVTVGRAWVTPYAVLGYWLIAGLGMGLAFSATSVLALALAPEGEQGRASSALQLCDGLGGVLGIGIAGAVFATAHHPGRDDGPVLGWIWVGLAVVGASAAITGARSRLRA